MVKIIARMRKLHDKVRLSCFAADTPENAAPELTGFIVSPVEFCIADNTLLWIRCGPGALILPKEVSKISMEFNTHIYGGHRGARKFWREMLPRIKYRNPSVPIEISRHKDPNGPSLLHIYTSAKAASATPPSDTPNASQPTHTIDIRNKMEGEILDALVATIDVEELKPTEQEVQEMADMRDFKERSEKDRIEVREKLLLVRREQELLKLARGEVPIAV